MKQRYSFKVGQQVYLHISIPGWWIKRSSLINKDTTCLAKGIISSITQGIARCPFYKVRTTHIATHTLVKDKETESIIRKLLGSTVKRTRDQLHPSITSWMEQVYKDVYWNSLNPTQIEEIQNRIRKK